MLKTQLEEASNEEQRLASQLQQSELLSQKREQEVQDLKAAIERMKSSQSSTNGMV